MGTREKAIEGLESGLYKTQAEAARSLGCTEARISQIWNEHTGGKKLKDNGDFDLREYLRGNLPDIAQTLVHKIKTGKGTKSIEVALKALGELVEKREETHKFELTPADYTNIGRATIDGLRADLDQFGGVCAVCGQPKTLRLETRLHTESEQPENREVGTVAVSARPD